MRGSIDSGRAERGRRVAAGGPPGPSPRPGLPADVVLALLGLLGLLATGGCGEASRVLPCTGTLDLFDFVGEASDRAAGGTAIANFPEERDALMIEAKTDRVFVTELRRAIVFDGLRVPGDSVLEVAIRVQPPEVYRPASLGAIFRVRTTDGELHTARALLARPDPGAWIQVRHPLGLEGEIDRLEIGFPAVGPSPPGALLALARPRLTFATEVVRRRRDEPRQVLLLTLDTTRRDALGCYGGPGARTPNLDALAADGLRFEDCHSVTNGTNPAHASIFSSLHLKDHAVKDNFTRLDPACPTFLDVLGDEGFRRAAFTSSFSFQPERSGFAGRFDDYHPCKVYYERRAEDVNQELLPWLTEHHEEDFFVWAHYFDAHMPYDPPPPFDTGFEVPGDDPIEDSVYAELPETFLRSRRLQDYVAAYRGEVAYLDARIGELLQHLRDLEIYGRATIVVVGDHGESLGENGIFFDHVGLFDDVTTVPLLVKAPGDGPKGVVPGLVSILDVHPTVLDLLGIENPQAVRGRSLAGALHEGFEPLERVYLEHGRGESLAVRTERWLCVLDRVDRVFFPGYALHEGRVSLFDLAADPGAEVDVAGSEADVAKRLGVDLETFPADARGYRSTPIEDPDYLKALEHLGYGG